MSAQSSRASAPIVVGIDASAGSELALDWAVLEAQARQAPLRIVHVAEKSDGETRVPRDDAEEGYQRVNRVLFDALDRIAASGQQVDVTCDIDESGDPAHALVVASVRAAMVVVGSRRRGPLGSALLGSVGASVAQRAVSPVVVVRGPAGDPARGARVVVGIEPDDSSNAALGFAFDRAAAHQVGLDAVLCYHSDVVAELAWRAGLPAPNDLLSVACESISGWREKYPEVDARAAVVRGHPAAALAKIAHAQDLLVVGRGRRGVVMGALLGSTSSGVLHHATCPVAVVPDA